MTLVCSKSGWLAYRIRGWREDNSCPKSRDNRAYQRSAMRPAMGATSASAGIEIDVKVLGLEDLEIKFAVLDLVPAEVLGVRHSGEREEEEQDHGQAPGPPEG